jgi:ribosome biogenesis SPOUT family RNA methylase Rps3
MKTLRDYINLIESAEQVVESTDELFHDWMNSEYAPFDSDAGDDKIVTKKAEHYLHGKMHPKKVEKLALLLSKKFHGD